MPELPEVQTTVNGLQAKVLNRTFIDVWSDWEKLVRRPASFKQFKQKLRDKKILRVWRRAKNVIFELSDWYSLLIHMKMTGHLLVGSWKLGAGSWKPVAFGPLHDKINGFLHMVFTLDNGTMIALSDMRKFAKVELVSTEHVLQGLAALGPEPLDTRFTFERFQQCFTKRRGKVKQVIMDQTVIAGIGNIYASEALWLAKIHPEKQVGKLSRRELRSLYRAIRKVLALGIKFGGDSFSDYRNVDGHMGTFEGKKNVYQREGNPCYRCKKAIKRVVVGARSSFFCPRCQKL